MFQWNLRHSAWSFEIIGTKQKKISIIFVHCKKKYPACCMVRCEADQIIRNVSYFRYCHAAINLHSSRHLYFTIQLRVHNFFNFVYLFLTSGGGFPFLP